MTRQIALEPPIQILIQQNSQLRRARESSVLIRSATRRPAHALRWEILPETHRSIRRLPNDRTDFELARAYRRKQVRLQESWDRNGNSFPCAVTLPRFSFDHNSRQTNHENHRRTRRPLDLPRQRARHEDCELGTPL